MKLGDRRQIPWCPSVQNECSRGIPLSLALVLHLVQSQEMDVDLGMVIYIT